MPGRQRRARALAALLCITIVFFLYERNAPVANQYAEYVRDKAVGGGAVMRPVEETPDSPAAVEPTSTSNAYPPKTPSIASHVTAPPATPADFVPPRLADEEDLEDPDYYKGQGKAQLPVEVGEGRIDQDTYGSSSQSGPHWTKPVEQFPVSSTIQLPSGNPKSIPRIQHGKKGSADNERLAAIKAATQHAWKGYTSKALGYDEVKPVSGTSKNSFNGWGATLVDSLDTLWIMGMTKEFEEALVQVQKIDFSVSSRSDIPLFEVTIRYLGGLLAAYDVSNGKYQILLDKAVELAEILYGAFDTPNRMPITYYNWKPSYSSQPHRAGSRVVLAELGTLSVEFTRLAQITREPKYYDAIARITDAFDEWQNRTRLPGMWPTWVDASGCRNSAKDASNLWNFREQMVPDSDRKMVAGPPSRPGQSGKQSSAAYGHETDKDSLSIKEMHSLADKSSFADDVQNRRGSGAARQKRQTSPLPKNVSDGERATFSFEPADETANDSRNIDTKTGEELCLDAGLNSSAYAGSETFTLGGMSDSVYEYLPKEYLLLGGRLDQYKDMYLASTETIIKKLLFRPMTPENHDILFTGDMMVSLNFTSGLPVEARRYKSEHLSCFVGGMFAMGGKIFENPQHVEIGRRLTDGCIWAYNSTASGIMPETFLLSACAGLDQCKYNQTQYYEELDPFADTRKDDPEFFRKKVYYSTLLPTPKTTTSASSTSTLPPPKPTETLRTGPKPQRMLDLPANNGDDDSGDHGLRKRQLGEAAIDVPKHGATTPESNSPPRLQHSGPNFYKGDNSPSHTSSIDDTTPQDFYWAPETQADYVEAKIKSEHLPPGFTQLTSTAYILRPEAIESVFYMYRITGEQHWRDAGWAMFRAVESATHAEFGHSAVHDVSAKDPSRTDQMESFWIAETLKYFYLLFDDPDNWSLDDWVLNTEAHFFRRPTNPAAAR